MDLQVECRGNMFWDVCAPCPPSSSAVLCASRCRRAAQFLIFSLTVSLSLPLWTVSIVAMNSSKCAVVCCGWQARRASAAGLSRWNRLPLDAARNDQGGSECEPVFDSMWILMIPAVRCLLLLLQRQYPSHVIAVAATRRNPSRVSLCACVCRPPGRAASVFIWVSAPEESTRAVRVPRPVRVLSVWRARAWPKWRTPRRRRFCLFERHNPLDVVLWKPRVRAPCLSLSLSL